MQTGSPDALRRYIPAIAREACLLLWVVSVISLFACNKAELTQLREALASAELKLATATEGHRKLQGDLQLDLTSTRTAFKTAQDEVTQIKATPQYIYREAIKPTESDSDEGDSKAIEALGIFVEHYPTDPLVPAAKTRAAQLDRRIRDRAARLYQAQSDVRTLLSRCESLSKQAETTRTDGIRYNDYGLFDFNSAMSASADGSRILAQAKAAKAKGLQLVEHIPDPNGTLKAKLEKCDDDD